MTENELARALFGRKKQAAEEAGSATVVVSATAVNSSSGGTVVVDFGTDVFGDTQTVDEQTGQVVYEPPSQGVEVPAAGGISAGDTVSVLVVDNQPVQAIGTGSVDRVGAVAESAKTTADEAAAVAAAVGQHFWHDTRGAHVTEEEREDYETQASGFQQLMTSIGTLLTRAVNGIEYLLRSDTQSGMAIYDGTCTADDANLAQHQVARFSASGAQIGKSSRGHTVIDDDELKLYGTIYNPGQPSSIGLTGRISQDDVELGNFNGTTLGVKRGTERDRLGSYYRSGDVLKNDAYLNVDKYVSENVALPSNRAIYFSNLRHTYDSLYRVVYNGRELHAGIDFTLYPDIEIYVWNTDVPVGATLTITYETTDRVTRFGLNQAGARGDDNALGIFPSGSEATPNFGVNWNGRITHIEGSTTKADNLSYVTSTDSIRAPTLVTGYTGGTGVAVHANSKVRRSGRQVNAHLIFNVASNSGTVAGAVFVTGLPRPYETSWCTAALTNGSKSCRMYIDGSGNLRLDMARPDVGWWTCAVSYFTQD